MIRHVPEFQSPPKKHRSHEQDGGEPQAPNLGVDGRGVRRTSNRLVCILEMSRGFVERVGAVRGGFSRWRRRCEVAYHNGFWLCIGRGRRPSHEKTVADWTHKELADAESITALVQRGSGRTIGGASLGC